MLAGSGPSTPATSTVTVRPARRRLSASSSRRASPGCGAAALPLCSGPSSSSRRRKPSKRCISATACRLDSSMLDSTVAASSGERDITRRAAPACTPITLT